MQLPLLNKIRRLLWKINKTKIKTVYEDDFDKIFTFNRRAFNYSFLAVARPHHFGASDYIHRVEKHIENGVDRIYVIRAGNEVNFTNNVIDTIEEKVSGIKLAYRFNQYRDYRGDYGGVGALFAVAK